ncbi:hypothetical protein AMJ80_01125 [bacterium SM23_31]|nr:MAG: hypothetical protein AMJ80_01125 [bacterium SM23_31]
MKLDILKYTGLGIIGIFLIYANINMIGRLFFSGSSNAEEIKKFVITSNEAIADTLRSLWSIGEINNAEDGFTSLRGAQRRSNLSFQAESRTLTADSLIIIDAPIESNKRHIIYCDSLIGYAYIIHEPIACPTCSDINYFLITDNGYTIKHIIFLRDIVEGYKIIPVEKFEEFSNQFLNKNLLNDDFMPVKVFSNPENHSIYFKESIKKLQKQVRLFYEG